MYLASHRSSLRMHASTIHLSAKIAYVDFVLNTTIAMVGFVLSMTFANVDFTQRLIFATGYTYAPHVLLGVS
jgi:hypothetical protein